MIYIVMASVFVFAVRCGIISSIVLSVLLAAFYLLHREKYARLMIAMVIGAMVVVYNSFGSQMTTQVWAFRWFDTLAGKSSCTNNPRVSLPYNAAGVFYSTESELYQPWAFCPFPEYRWGDNTGKEFTDSSKDARDYIMNPGRGLSQGWSFLANKAETGLCPGMSRELNSVGQVGKGDPIPTVCLYTFVQAGLMKEQRRYSYEWNSLCRVCPGYFDSWSISCVRLYWVWLVFWFFVCLAATGRTTLCCWCSKCRKRKE